MGVLVVILKQYLALMFGGVFILIDKVFASQFTSLHYARPIAAH